MIYKNGIKEYTMTTLLFGGPMGVLSSSNKHFSKEFNDTDKFNKFS